MIDRQIRQIYSQILKNKILRYFKEINMETENHPEMERNIICQTVFFGGSMLMFQGVYAEAPPKKRNPQPPRLVAIRIHPILSKKKQIEKGRVERFGHL